MRQRFTPSRFDWHEWSYRIGRSKLDPRRAALALRMRKAGYSQREVGEHFNVGPDTIRRLERGGALDAAKSSEMSAEDGPEEPERTEAVEPDPEPPELAPGQFPPYVRTRAEKLRFRNAVGVARVLFGEDGEDHVWMAARSLYRNPNISD